PLLRAGGTGRTMSADHMPVTANPGENKLVRHSSAGGINLQTQRYRSVRLARRNPRHAATSGTAKASAPLPLRLIRYAQGIQYASQASHRTIGWNGWARAHPTRQLWQNNSYRENPYG